MKFFTNYYLSLFRFTFDILLLTGDKIFFQPEVVEKANVEFILPSFSLKNNQAFLIKKPNFLLVSIAAFNSHFVLFLFPINNFSVVIRNRSNVIFSDYVHYLGRLTNRVETKAYGYLYNDVFIGSFTTPDEMFHIEPLGTEKKKVLIYKDSKFTKNFLNIIKVNIKPNKKKKLEIIQRNEKEFSFKNKVCNIRINVDHTFTRFFKNQVEKILGEMYQLILLGNDIFVSQDFDDDGIVDKVGFRLKKITIYSDRYDADYKLRNERMSAPEMLDAVAYNYEDEDCLDVWVTSRVLRKSLSSILGVTYEGKLNNNTGICAKKTRIGNKALVKRNKSIINIPNNLKTTRLDKVIAFAHEMGHAFGATHEKSFECRFNKKGKLFIMTNPVENYNKQTFTFSECSLQKMKTVLEVKASCFEATPATFCGDGIVSENEECDCGPSQYCNLVDECCYSEEQENPCTRKPNCFLQDYCAIKYQILGYKKLTNPFCKLEYLTFVKKFG